MQRPYEENAADPNPAVQLRILQVSRRRRWNSAMIYREKCLTFPGGVGTYTGTFTMTAVEGLLAR